MYLDASKYKIGGKEYTRYLLRSSYRENGKIKKRTHGSLNNCTESEINAIKIALQLKDDISSFQNISKLNIQQGQSFGALYVLNKIANKLKIREALSKVIKDEKQVNLAIWQIIFKCINHSSKFASFRLFDSYAINDVLDLNNITKYDIYNNLSIISENAKEIEKTLFNLRTKSKKPELFLYDVTSSYFEGEHNEYAKYGYNRDKKSGKLQLVIGLLTDDVGTPISATIFEGNTNDTKTVKEQIDFLSKELNLSRITIVGDRGMLKGPQIESLPKEYSYITAITRSQINTLIKNSVLNHDLFAEDLQEVEYENIRYIMRLNSYRREEIITNRTEKILRLESFIKEQNEFLTDPKHKRAKLSISYNKLRKKCEKINLNFIEPICDEKTRTIGIKIDHDKKKDLESLDGCYCLITNLPNTTNKDLIHTRYKGLAQVERAFRTIKTDHLELRPIYVRKKESTEAHVLITSLAYSIIQEITHAWKDINVTVEEGIALLDKICYQELSSNSMNKKYVIPNPDNKSQKLLECLNIKLSIRKKKKM